MRINLVKTLLPALAATALAAPNMGMMNDFPKGMTFIPFPYFLRWPLMVPVPANAAMFSFLLFCL